MQDPKILTYIDAILNKAGIDDLYLASHLREIIERATTKQALKKVAPADGLRGIEMAYKLKDRFPAQRTQIDKREVSVKLQGKSPEELLETLSEVGKQIESFKRMVGTRTETPPVPVR